MLHMKVDMITDNGVTTLCDEELDVVSAGAATYSFTVSANQTGNASSAGTVTLTLTQGQTGQNHSLNGLFTTS
jgi:hypothetical protein